MRISGQLLIICLVLHYAAVILFFNFRILPPHPPCDCPPALCPPCRANDFAPAIPLIRNREGKYSFTRRELVEAFHIDPALLPAEDDGMAEPDHARH